MSDTAREETMATAEQALESTEAIPDEIVNTVVHGEASVAPRRYFTVPGRDPFDEIEWEIRDAHIPGRDGPAFEQKDVEFPKFWSQTATNIVAQTRPTSSPRSTSAAACHPPSASAPSSR